MAMAVPNSISRAAVARAIHFRQMPTRRAIPSPSSAAVDVHARNGIVHAGINEFTSAVYLTKFWKLPYPTSRPYHPNRDAIPERNARARAMRVNVTTAPSRLNSVIPFRVRGTFWDVVIGRPRLLFRPKAVDRDRMRSRRETPPAPFDWRWLRLHECCWQLQRNSRR